MQQQQIQFTPQQQALYEQYYIYYMEQYEKQYNQYPIETRMAWAQQESTKYVYQQIQQQQNAIQSEQMRQGYQQKLNQIQSNAQQQFLQNQQLQQQQKIQQQTQLNQQQIELQKQQQKQQEQQQIREQQLIQQLKKQEVTDKIKEKEKQVSGTSRWSKSIVLTNQMYEKLGLQKPEGLIDDKEILEQKQQEQQDQPQLEQWPDSLKEYIKKCLQKCKTIKDQGYMQQNLPIFLKQMENQGKLFDHKWENEPLQLTFKEKQEQIQQQQMQMQQQQQQQLPLPPIQQLNMQQNITQIDAPIPIKTNNSDTLRGSGSLQQTLSKQENGQQNLKRTNPYTVNSKVIMPGQENEAINTPIKKRIIQNNQNGGEILTSEGQKMKYQQYVIQDFEEKASQHKIVGTNQKLEKKYMRRDQDVDASEIRPERILQQSLKLILKKWKNQEVNYTYMQDQFRSMRQDLKIQGIKNKFFVQVCEHNARICLESQDVQQFSECLTSLFTLYDEGINGENEEFMCYQLIYYHINKQKNHVAKIMYKLKDIDYESPVIQFFFDLHAATSTGNVQKFFELYKEAPKMASYVIDTKIDEMRVWGLQQVCKGFGQTIDINYLEKLMAFNDFDHLQYFLENKGIKIKENKINLKDTIKLLNKK